MENYTERWPNASVDKQAWVRDAAAGIVPEMLTILSRMSEKQIPPELRSNEQIVRERMATNAVRMALAIWDAADKAFEGKV